MAEDPFVTSTSGQQQPLHLYRPIPRRNFSINTDSSDSPSQAPAEATPPGLPDSQSRSSDFLSQLNARLLRTYNARMGNAYEGLEEKAPPPRNSSYLNMKSTLMGIYDDVGTAGETSVAETPWGTGAETPAHAAMGFQGWENGMSSSDGGVRMKNLARTRSINGQGRPNGKRKQKPQRRGVWKYMVILSKLSALFLFGVIYGAIVGHLYATKELSAVRVGGLDHESWIFLGSWGFAGVVLGSLLPYVDLLWEESHRDDETQEEEDDSEKESALIEQINEVVRSVGAFIGIAFAIRRLPWQSTLQLTLTLALVNPALWYILDRSKPGFTVSLIATSILTSFIILSNPKVLPSPSLPASINATHLPSSTRATPPAVQQELFVGLVSYDNLATVTWVGSVLFCSCICFGSIGRRLALLDDWTSKGR